MVGIVTRVKVARPRLWRDVLRELAVGSADSETAIEPLHPPQEPLERAEAATVPNGIAENVDGRTTTEDDITCIVLSFEGPDVYSHVGGLGSRVAGLSTALARQGHETHLFFIGDPELPGLELRNGGRLQLHRWCQWISRFHRNGAYDAEDQKVEDWNRSLPAWIETNILEPKIASGGYAVVLAEEWHTAESVIALHEIVERRGWRDRVQLVWNANNTYSFDRLDWDALEQAAVITTVSRHMKQIMADMGIESRVIANGIPESWLRQPSAAGSSAVSSLLSGRTSLVKVARWDPDKGWFAAIDAVSILKGMGARPILVARGGTEPYGDDVVERAEGQGLSVARVVCRGSSAAALVQAIKPHIESDVIILERYINASQRRTLFQAADAVLANSRWEPFGLVGLETMTVGGIAVVGCTGEDYATPGYDAIAMQTDDPMELVRHIVRLNGSVLERRRIRGVARSTAARYTWPLVIRNALFPTLGWVTANGKVVTRFGAPVRREPGLENVYSAGTERMRAIRREVASSQAKWRNPAQPEPEAADISTEDGGEEVPDPERKGAVMNQEVNRANEIREIAYYIWEQEGRPDGKDQEHYLRAEQIWESRQRSSVAVASPAQEQPGLTEKQAAIPSRAVSNGLTPRRAARRTVGR